MRHIGIAMLLPIFAVASFAQPSEVSYLGEVSHRLDALVTAARGTSPLMSMPDGREEKIALLELGPGVVPQTLERLGVEENVYAKLALRGVLISSLRVIAFPYSQESKVVQGIDYLETAQSDLPEDSFCFFPDVRHPADRFELALKVWNSRDTLPNVQTRLQKLQRVAAVKKTTAAEITGEDYRVFLRETCTKGILELPVLIALVCRDNSLLAFYQFMRLSGGPLRKGDTDPLAELAWLNEHYPNAGDRVDCVRLWWSNDRDKYTGLTPLQQQIDEAVGCIKPASD